VNVLNRSTLILNKNWAPVYIDTVKHALIKVFNDSAMIMDHDDYNLYDWESWIKLEPRDGDFFIRTQKKNIRAPEIIILKSYDKIPVYEVKLTRKNLLVRDGFRCAYSGKKLRLHDATIDHVVPKCKGGNHSWDNVVISSKEMNTKKGNKTPVEAGLKLKKRPAKPAWHPLYTSMVPNVPESWKKFFHAKAFS